MNPIGQTIPVIYLHLEGTSNKVNTGVSYFLYYVEHIYDDGGPLRLV